MGPLGSAEASASLT